MNTLGFSRYRPRLFEALAAVLHIGNIQFIQNSVNGMESVNIVDSMGRSKRSGWGNGQADRCSSTLVAYTVSTLLSIDLNQFIARMVSRTSVTRGETFVTTLTMEQACESRDAMAKALYGRMFAWIVAHINATTKGQEETSQFVGVLDIFGFENFDVWGVGVGDGEWFRVVPARLNQIGQRLRTVMYQLCK